MNPVKKSLWHIGSHFAADITPETIRAQGHLRNITLLEPIKMDETLLANFAAPRFENGKAMLIAGLGERYNQETCAGIPAQWQRFGPHMGHIRGQVGTTAYGVCSNGDDAGNFDYLCGVEVSEPAALPPEFSRVSIPAQRYAVFSHRDHISEVRHTWNTIWNKWLPESGHEAADAPNFERYDEHFNPVTGMGGLEIWLPLKK